MPPVPNEKDAIPVQLVSQEPVDIENLLKLNPRIKPHANAVPSIVTKKVSAQLCPGCPWISLHVNIVFCPIYID